MRKAFMLLAASVVLLSNTGCNKKIDGARFIVTKSIIKAVSTDANDTSETKEDDLFTVSLAITMTVNIGDPTVSIIVDETLFKFSKSLVSYYMTDLTGNKKSTIECKGPEADDLKTVVTWVKLEVNVGADITYDNVRKIQSELKLEYKGTNLYLPTAVQYL